VFFSFFFTVLPIPLLSPPLSLLPSQLPLFPPRLLTVPLSRASYHFPFFFRLTHQSCSSFFPFLAINSRYRYMSSPCPPVAKVLLGCSAPPPVLSGLFFYSFLVGPPTLVPRIDPSQDSGHVHPSSFPFQEVAPCPPSFRLGFPPPLHRPFFFRNGDLSGRQTFFFLSTLFTHPFPTSLAGSLVRWPPPKDSQFFSTRPNF